MDRIRQAEATQAERISDRELVVTRHFRAPAHLVFRAWTTAEAMLQWWVPKSFGMTFISCEMDARTGGSYRFVFGHPASDQPMAFFGRYLEVVPNSRLVWTNEEAGENGQITTLTFTETAEGTDIRMLDLYPSKEALDEALESGSNGGYDESFGQLDGLLVEWAKGQRG